MIRRTIWAIGGVDSSGGAGVTRDALTAYDLGVLTRQCVTLVSAQSDQHFYNSEAVDSYTLRQQLDALIASALPDAIKIGAIHSDEQALLIVSRLALIKAQAPELPIIWDPISRTSSGGNFCRLGTDAIESLMTLATLVTPNVAELAYLTGCEVTGLSDMHDAAVGLLADYGCAVLAKGGHLLQREPATDILVNRQDCIHFTGQRYSADLRGTGCMLASALAASCALGYSLNDACCIAKAYLSAQFRLACNASSAHGQPLGWPEHSDDFPVVHVNNAPITPPATPFSPLENTAPGLYPVVDSLAWFKMLLPTGVPIMQLRIKGALTQQATDDIRQAITLASAHNCQLFINDHWQLALQYRAYGVHLGQEDLKNADLHALAEAGVRLGVSTHGYAELCRIRTLKPSYIALGHIFPTQTKVMPSRPQGLINLARYQALCGHTPTVAIGGISQARVDDVLNCGVTRIAMVTGLTKASQPAQQAKAIQQQIEDFCVENRGAGYA